MKLAFYKAPGNFYDKAIRTWMRGTYSHVELVVGEHDGQYLCWSSSPRDGGIRAKTMPLPADRWDIIDITGDIDRAHDWFAWVEGARYDWLGILGFVIRPVKGSSDKYHCSGAVAAALGVQEPWRLDPNALHSLATSRLAVLNS